MKALQLAEILGNAEEQFLIQAMEAGRSVRRKPAARRIRFRRALAVAAVFCLLFALSSAAFAANWFGLRDLLLPVRESDLLSLSGLAGSPEYQASAQWNQFLAEYDTSGLNYESFDSRPDPQPWESYYSVFSSEMSERLQQIAEQYGLALHTMMVDDLYTDDALCGQVGGDFLGENSAHSAYIYEDGSFHFDGDLPLGGEVIEYQFTRCVRGSLTDISLRIENVDSYTVWNYETACGVPVSLASDGDRSLIVADLPDSLVTINVLSRGLSSESLQTLADSFDFSVLTPALPADPDLPRPTLDEALGRPSAEEFAAITGMEEADAQQFFTQFVRLLESGDPESVLAQIAYPVLLITETQPILIESADALLPWYDRLITEGLWEQIRVNQYDKTHFDLAAYPGAAAAAGGTILFSCLDGEFRILSLEPPDGYAISPVAGME